MRVLNEKPLLRYDDDRLRLFFLGVGWSFSRKHFQTNLLIVKGADHLLVDFGTRGPQALEQVAGLKSTDIRVILPTHSHADHIGGLEEMALLNRFQANKSRPKMIITEAYQRLLWEESLCGGLGHNQGAANGPGTDFNDYFEPLRPQEVVGASRESYRIKIGKLSVEIFRTRHIPDKAQDLENCCWSCGLYIDDRIFYSGDTRFDPELIELYQGAECFFHDCQLQPGPVHASYRELKELPLAVRKRMLLMHYGDDWECFRPAEDGFFSFAEQGIQYLF
jgi:ribonuclease BN (tRNA processing enzyme)